MVRIQGIFPVCYNYQTNGADAEIHDTPSEPEVTYLLGDVNDEGKVNVKDATAIQKFAPGLGTGCPVGEERKSKHPQ